MPSYIFVVAVVLRPLEQHVMMPVPLIFKSFISIYVKQHKNTFFLLLLVFKIVIHNYSSALVPFTTIGISPAVGMVNCLCPKAVMNALISPACDAVYTVLSFG